MATPGRMRLATKLRGKPHTGARPTMSRRSGKPLKKRPKKPSTSPAVNHSGRPLGCILRRYLAIALWANEMAERVCRASAVGAAHVTQRLLHKPSYTLTRRGDP